MYMNTERRVGLCLQAEGNQFQLLLYPICVYIYQGMYSASFVFVGKLLRDLQFLMRGFLWMNNPVLSRHEDIKYKSHFVYFNTQEEYFNVGFSYLK
jgi:hypothetical protein